MSEPMIERRTPIKGSDIEPLVFMMSQEVANSVVNDEDFQEAFEGRTGMEKRIVILRARDAANRKCREMLMAHKKDESITDAEIEDQTRGAAEDAVREFLFGKEG